MTGDDRRSAHRQVAFAELQIGATDPAGRQPEAQLARPGRRRFERPKDQGASSGGRRMLERHGLAGRHVSRRCRRSIPTGSRARPGNRGRPERRGPSAPLRADRRISLTGRRLVRGHRPDVFHGDEGGWGGTSAEGHGQPGTRQVHHPALRLSELLRGQSREVGEERRRAFGGGGETEVNTWMSGIRTILPRNPRTGSEPPSTTPRPRTGAGAPVWARLGEPQAPSTRI